MTKQQAIRKFGSVKALAAALKINPAAVYQWGTIIPELRVYQIRAYLKRNGK